MSRTLIALLVMVAMIAQGRDIVTVPGDVYRKVTVTRVERTGIRITHNDGVAFLDFKILSPQLRKEFGYTEEAYAAAQAELVNAEAERNRQASEIARVQIELQQERERQRTAALEAERQRLLALEAQKQQAAAIANRVYGTDRGYAGRDYSTPRTRSEPPPVVSTPSPAPMSSGQCIARTKKGYQCSRRAQPGTSTCWQH